MRAAHQGILSFIAAIPLKSLDTVTYVTTSQTNQYNKLSVSIQLQSSIVSYSEDVYTTESSMSICNCGFNLWTTKLIKLVVIHHWFMINWLTEQAATVESAPLQVPLLLILIKMTQLLSLGMRLMSARTFAIGLLHGNNPSSSRLEDTCCTTTSSSGYGTNR